jgi:hypothetical protein
MFSNEGLEVQGMIGGQQEWQARAPLTTAVLENI